MAAPFITRLRRWNVAWHRDLGYFFSALIIIYSLSGIALNHINDWDPDFVIYKKHIQLQQSYVKVQINAQTVQAFGRLVGEENYKVFDFPTNNQVKIYYDNATLHINFENGKGEYEKLTKRHLFYESNLLHRNSIKGWKWVSDIFACFLIIISVTGLFILKGKYGFKRRGIWFVLAGLLLPIAALMFFYFVTAG